MSKKSFVNSPETTSGRPAYSVTTGGHAGVPLRMLLGDYVNTSCPSLVLEPPLVRERDFTGGRIVDISLPFASSAQAQDNEALSRSLRLAELFFVRHLSDLLTKYKGQFVAILDNKVVDVDPNLDHLMARVYEKFGYRPILMRRVELRGEQPSRLPSPRRAQVRRDAI